MCGRSSGFAVSRSTMLAKISKSRGEVSGKLDESLGSIRRYYNEEGMRKLQTLAAWVPKLVYFTVMLVIAYGVINFYIGYLKQIETVGKF